MRFGKCMGTLEGHGGLYMRFEKCMGTHRGYRGSFK